MASWDAGGFHLDAPDDDTVADLRALLRAIWWNDPAGQEAVLANADLRPLCEAVATLAAALLVRNAEPGPDRPRGPLTAAEVHAGEGLLMMVLTVDGEHI